MIPAAAVAVLLAVLWVAGHSYSRSLERRIDSRLSRASTGIIVGAEDIAYPGTNGAAVLLVHGGGDTPETLKHVADELRRRGYAVVAPLLPGHGRNLRSLDEHTDAEWFDTVQRSYARLESQYAWTGAVGLSMGGALLVRLATDTPTLRALVLLSPYLSMPTIGGYLARLSWLWAPFVPAVNTVRPGSVLDPAARAASRGYGAMSARALGGLARTARRGWQSLPAVRAPTLFVQSTTDNRIRSTDAQRAFDRLGCTDKVLEWIEGAGHVITVDYGWQRVAQMTGDWLDAHRAVGTGGSPRDDVAPGRPAG